MELSAKEAVEKLSQQMVLAPSLDPHYVLIDAKRDPSIQVVFFLYEDEGGCYYHGFHRMPIPNTPYYDIQSPYGYGGPLVLENREAGFLKRAWQAYLEFCAQKNIVVEMMRFHPLLENWQSYQGETIFQRETVWVDLQVPDLLSSYEIRARTAVRKAAHHHIQIEFIDKKTFLPLFKSIYEAGMRQLQADTFYFFNDAYLEAICSWEKARLAIAKQDDEVLAVGIFLLRENILEYHLSAATEQGKKLSASNLMLHHAFLMAKEAGFAQAHLGGGSSNQADDRLLFFKKGHSKLKSAYHIGKFVHQPSAYEALAEAWQAKTGQTGTRILFYRT